MHEYASETQEARELLSDLEYLWDQVKDIQPSTSPSAESTEPLDNMSAAISAAGLLGRAGSNAGSYTSFDPRIQRMRGGSSVSGLQHLESYGGRSATASAAGGSYIGVLERSARHPDRGRKARNTGRPKQDRFGSSTGSFDGGSGEPGESDNLEMRKWRRDVTWALETINEEIMAMRHRYASATGTESTVLPPMPMQMPMNDEMYPPMMRAGSSNRQRSIYSYNGQEPPSASEPQGLPVLIKRRNDANNTHNHDLMSHSSSTSDAQPWRRTMQDIIKYIMKQRIWRVLAGLLWGVGKHVVIDLAVIQALLILTRYSRNRYAPAGVPGRAGASSAARNTMFSQIIMFWGQALAGIFKLLGVQIVERV